MVAKIGDVTIQSGAVLAPMAGVTDAPFRLLCREQGAVLTVTEMISAKGTLCAPPDNRAQRDLLWTLPGSGPTALQIFGNDPVTMVEAAKRLTARQHFCLVDINMGCPAPKIVREGAGSALLREPLLAARIIEALAGALPIPVTVKMRIGWELGEDVAVPFARMAQESGAAAVTVHGRTRTQFYAGAADWAAVAAVKAVLRIPVLGNGDIDSPEDALARVAQTGCDGVMVGRGAMGNPWLFAQIATAMRGETMDPPGLPQRMETAARHLRMMVDWKGAHAAVPEMRKHIGWYIKGLPGAASIRAAVNHMQSMEDMLDCLTRIGTETVTPK